MMFRVVSLLAILLAVNTFPTESSGEADGSAAAATCTVLGECYNNDDCHGGTCIGAFLETCKCNACINFWMCSSDNDCGGLKSSCSNGFCDCYGAYTRNNYTSVVNAWTNLC